LSISSKGEMALRQKSENGAVPRGMLSVVPLTGGAPRELLGDVLQASWSRNGESLAAVHFVGPECRLEYPVGKTIYSTTTGDISDVAVSPDDKRIAFFDHPNAADTRGYVAVVDLSGKATRLTKEWSDLTGLAWSRNGSYRLGSTFEEEVVTWCGVRSSAPSVLPRPPAPQTNPAPLFSPAAVPRSRLQ
jgi:hypothetical protein